MTDKVLHVSLRELKFKGHSVRRTSALYTGEGTYAGGVSAAPGDCGLLNANRGQTERQSDRQTDRQTDTRHTLSAVQTQAAYSALRF